MGNIIDLSNKTFFVTGAGSGIGRETALVLGEQGAHVVMLDLSQEGLDETLAAMSGTGHIAKVCDLSDIDALPAMMKDIIAETGPVDGLVHCAGISSRKPLNVLKAAGFQKVMDVNFYSFVELTRLLTKKGCMNDGGSIVVMSSISSIKGYKAKTEYCVSKAAVDAFVRCMAQELASKRIRVNSIMPGEVNTPLSQKAREMAVAAGHGETEEQPLGITEPREVANTIAFLLSDATQTITGTAVKMGGGNFLNSTSPFTLAGKKILVIGQTTGLEQSIIAQLMLMGASAVSGEINENSDVDTQIKEIVNVEKQFDGFVFSKTVSDFRPLGMTKHATLEKLMNDNYFLFIDILRTLVKTRALKQGASIVAISSISSIRSMKAKTAFASAKAALDASVRCLATELADRGIRINTIQKGFVDADLEKGHILSITAINGGAEMARQPLGMTKAEEVGNTVTFLLSDASHTITGTSIVIDGGYTL